MNRIFIVLESGRIAVMNETERTVKVTGVC